MNVFVNNLNFANIPSIPSYPSSKVQSLFIEVHTIWGRYGFRPLVVKRMQPLKGRVASLEDKINH
jgi:hypothetical protein